MGLTLLSGMWWLSCLLAIGSVGLMLCLIALRLVADRWHRAAEQRRGLVLQCLLSGTDADRLVPLIAHPLTTRELGNLITELSTLIRGADFHNAIERLDHAGATDRLLKMLRTGKREERLIACEALAHFRQERVAERLFHSAATANSLRVRIAACRALLQMGNRPALPQVLDWIRMENRPVPVEVSAMLLQMVDYAEQDMILRIQDDRDNAYVRAAMIWSLAVSGRYSALPLFEQLAAHPEAAIRTAAIQAIAEIGFATDLTVLTARLGDEDADVRETAARALGRIGGNDVIPHLSHLLNDQVWDVRYQAANALADLGTEGLAVLTEAAGGNAAESRVQTAALVHAERAGL